MVSIFYEEKGDLDGFVSSIEASTESSVLRAAGI